MKYYFLMIIVMMICFTITHYIDKNNPQNEEIIKDINDNITIKSDTIYISENIDGEVIINKYIKLK